jgi:hypothetical protein
VEWAAELPSIINGYKTGNIANGDETGLFFPMLLKKLLSERRKCFGGKLCKVRLTLQTEPDIMDTNTLVQNFRERWEGREKEEAE